MIRTTSICRTLAVLGAFAVALCGCGGGPASINGIGNSGNRLLGEGISRELADALAESDAVPAVSDDTLAAIFGAIVTRARSGDPEAALIVLRTAEAQRKPDEG